MTILKGNTVVIAVTVVAVAIAVGVMGWLFMKKSQAPAPQTLTQSVTTKPVATTSTLATYTNSKWGFEVGYPTGYEVNTDAEKATELDLSIRKTGDIEEAKNSDGVCANCAFRLQVLPRFIGGTNDGDFKTPEDWVKFQKGLGSTYSQTTLAGETAYVITEQGTGRKTYLVFVTNGAMYDRYDISVKGNNSNADIMLQAFKFIK